MLTRRRFLSVTAAALAVPASATGLQTWTGQAMGAAARLVLSGCGEAQAQRVFRKVEGLIRQVEGQFSLHRNSELTRLNRNGRLRHPDGGMLDLFRLCDAVHAATGGIFDPTIQPLWLATAKGGDVGVARQLVGWKRVRVAADEIALDPGMQLTFNGIAQGHAADRVANLLRAEGFTDVLVDMGETVALGERPGGGGWRADIVMPDGATVARAILSDRALATSSPGGTLIGSGKSHIIHPLGAAAHWRLASVSAPSAALADALSTAFCLMDESAIARALLAFPAARVEALT